MNTAKFLGVIVYPGSGICTMQLELQPNKQLVRIPADASPTMRALRDSGLKVGQTIEYTVTDWGTMEGFNVIDED